MTVATTSIWNRRPNLEELNDMAAGNMVGHLGIRLIDVGDDFLEGTMPVDERTLQPFGILHGGASLALAETLASLAGQLVAGETRRVAGIAINANHVRSVEGGEVRGRAYPIHLGSSTQVWRVEIFGNDGKLVCDSRVTLAVIGPRETASLSS